MNLRALTLASGAALSAVAAATIWAMPLIAVAAAIGGAGCGLFLKRSQGAEASDVTNLSSIIMVSACGSVLMIELCSSRPVVEFARAHLVGVVERLLFNFGDFINGYLVVCFVLLVAIMVPGDEEPAQHPAAADRPNTDGESA
jgi:hypothetical protein